MLTPSQQTHIRKQELLFQNSRSGGKGGQNVNKVETKVELRFNIVESGVLSESQKHKLLEKYPALVDGQFIQMNCSAYRTQLQNKEGVIAKFFELLDKLLKPIKKRKATKPSKAVKEKKLKQKKHRGETKELRRKIKKFE